MIKELGRTLNGTYYSSNSNIVFDGLHYLGIGNKLEIYFNTQDSKYSATVSNVASNTIVTTNFSDANYNNKRAVVQTNVYGNGITGVQSVFSLHTATTPNILIQAIATGNTVINLEGSTNNSEGWVTLGVLNANTNNSNTAYLNITAPWPYGRLNIVSIDTGKNVKINKST